MDSLLAIAILINGVLFQQSQPAAVGSASEIDNQLKKLPVVGCEDTMISLTFETEKPFSGRVYVQGLSDDSKCSRSFASNEDQTSFSMMISQGDCSMQRQRMIGGEMEGMMFSLVVVISFHGTFVTQVDRAFRCMCYFRNMKRVTNLIDISGIGTTELFDTVAMPTCTYSIRSGSPNGSLIRYGKIGDKIYHVWECDDQNQGFLVHSCSVQDGRNRIFNLLDIDGCAIDPIIQADLTYDPSLSKAYVETNGYKFSDTSLLNYMCVLEVCRKASGECQGLTPPACGRGKRSITLRHHSKEGMQGGMIEPGSVNSMEMDLSSQLNILDSLEDDALGPPTAGGISAEFLNKLNRLRPHQLEQQNTPNRICLLKPAFVVLLLLTAILFLCTAVGTSLLCLRQRHNGSKTGSTL